MLFGGWGGGQAIHPMFNHMRKMLKLPKAHHCGLVEIQGFEP